MKRKTTIRLMQATTAVFALSLSSCMSISDVASDDVYVMKGASIPVSESLTDETSYATYRYKKERNNRVDYYADNRSIFRRYNRYNSPYMGYNYNSRYNMNPYFGNTHFGHHGSGLMYMPGMGWTFAGGYMNPYGVYGHPHQMYGYGDYYGGFCQVPYMGYNPYSGWNSWGNNGWHGNSWGNNGWGNNGWGNNGWGNNGWGNNGWGNNGWHGNGWGNSGWGNNGWGNNNGGNTGGTTAGNHFSGPRGNVGGSGVPVRNSNYVGTVKSGENTVATSGRTINTAERIPSTVSRKPVGRGEITRSASSRETGNTISNGNNTGTVGRTQSNKTEVQRAPVRQETFNRPGEVNTAPVDNGNTRVNSGTNSRVTSPSRNTGNGSSVTTPSRNSGSGSTISTPSRNSGSGSTISSPSRNSGGSTISTPSRSSGSGSTVTSPSRGSSGSGSSGGSTRSGGSSGGSRR